MIYDKKLESERLCLRTLQQNDCTQEYADWLNDSGVNKYLETRFTVQNINLIKDFVQTINNSSNSYLFGIFLKDGNKHIGNIKIGPVHDLYQFAEISYFLGDKNQWGKGYAVEAIRVVTEFGFNFLNLNRIQAGVHGSNIASQKALQKCGYINESTLRNKIYYGIGDSKVWDDHLYFGILKKEFGG